MDLIFRIYKLFKEIAINKSQCFSGIGLVIYDPAAFDASSHCDLRPGVKCPHYNISDSGICDYLIEISDYHHTLHDGFHFVDRHGALTHTAQYFVPSIVNGVEPHQDHGVRLYSAMCGSTIKGVLFIGIMCSNGEIYIFRSGAYVDISKLEEKYANAII